MSTSEWLDPEEQAVVRAFSRSARTLFAQLDRELQRDTGMPRAYFEILMLLSRAPNRSMRMSELAEVTASQPSRMTHAVARLDAAGWVRREVCTEDRRGWSAVLTDQGYDALERAMPRHAQSFREHFLDCLTREQRAQLVEIGMAVLLHLDEVRGTHTAVMPQSVGALS